MNNAILPEAGTAHVEELNDPYLLWFFNSNIRTTAVVLNTMVRAGAAPTDVSPMVRWLVAARKNGRWGNTHENAVAMQALRTAGIGAAVCPDGVRVELTGTDPPAVVALLVGAGVAVHEVRRWQTGLDELFAQLTEGNGQ